MLLPCPHCGARDAAEFDYGGDAASRLAPADDTPAAAWPDQLYLRANPRGPHDELWFHAAGCRRWLRVRRDTRDNRVLRCDDAWALTPECAS